MQASPSEISYESHFTPIFKEKSNQMKKETGITIHAVMNDKISFEDFNKNAAEEIQVMSEGDDLSGYSKVIFPESFKQKYSDIMTFCRDGSVLLKFS